MKKTRQKLVHEIDELTEVVDFKEHELTSLHEELKKSKEEILAMKSYRQLESKPSDLTHSRNLTRDELDLSKVNTTGKGYLISFT